VLLNFAPSRRQRRGFTLVEMIVVVAIMALLAALAAPSMFSWVRNNKIRTVSDSLQNGLRTAQAEASRRSRQVVFSLTDDKPVKTADAYTAKDNGNNWAITTVALLGSDSAVSGASFIEAGILRDVGANVVIEGPASICFSSIGRLAKNLDPGITGADCELPTADKPVRYDIKLTDSVDGDRALRVTVDLGGQVRMCDPARTLSTSQPDGCAATTP